MLGGKDVSKVEIRADGCVCLPTETLAARGLAAGTPVVVERTDDGLLLLPALPDAKRIYVEPTTRCNLACSTCIRHSWQEQLGDMDFAVFERLVSQLRDFPELASVHFAGFGEPLSHPRIIDMVRAVAALGLGAEMTTNGLLLDGACARELIAAGLHTLVVSLDGARPETYRSVRAGAELGQVLEGIRRLLDLRERVDSPLPRLGVEFVAMRRNYRELVDLIRLGRKVGFDFVVVTHVLPYTQAMTEQTLYGNGPVDFGLPVNVALRYGFRRLLMPESALRTQRYCRFVGGSSLSVAWDGAVSPCYPFLHSHTAYVLGRRKEMQRWTLGNLRERPLAEIWMAPEYLRFRSRVRRFDFPSCADCVTVDGCYFSQTNAEDCWGNAPSCADCLWARGIIRCF